MLDPVELGSPEDRWAIGSRDLGHAPSSFYARLHVLRSPHAPPVRDHDHGYAGVALGAAAAYVYSAYVTTTNAEAHYSTSPR